MKTIADLKTTNPAAYAEAMDLLGAYSDCYKSMNNIRPRWVTPSNTTAAELETMMVSLQKEIVEAIDADVKENATIIDGVTLDGNEITKGDFDFAWYEVEEMMEETFDTAWDDADLIELELVA